MIKKSSSKSKLQHLRNDIAYIYFKNRVIIEITGTDRLTFLHGQTTNEIQKLKTGTGNFNAMVDHMGHGLFYFHLIQNENSIWIDIEKSQALSLMNRLDQFHFTEDVQFKICESLSHFYLTGPHVLEKLLHLNSSLRLKSMHQSHHFEISLHSKQMECLLFRNDRWNEIGISFIYESENHQLFEKFLFPLLGLETIHLLTPKEQEIARIESGIPLIGIDLTPQDVFPQSNLFSAISYEKGCYNGQEIIARLDTYGSLKKILFGVQFDQDIDLLPPIPIWHDSKIISNITSSIYSPTLKNNIGITNMPIHIFKQNLSLYINYKNHQIPIQIQLLPFVRGSGQSLVEPRI